MAVNGNSLMVGIAMWVKTDTPRPKFMREQKLWEFLELAVRFKEYRGIEISQLRRGCWLEVSRFQCQG